MEKNAMQKLFQVLEKEKNAHGAKIKITQNNSGYHAITLNKAARRMFEEQGAAVNSYYSERKSPLSYKAILDIAKTCEDITIMAE